MSISTFIKYRVVRLVTNDCTKYTYSSRRDRSKIAPYQLATGTVPGPNGTMPRPDSCAGNVNYFNCRAVSVHNRGSSTILINSLLSLFGGAAHP